MHEVFRFPVKVLAEDIDVLKHVNNEVYLKWLIEAAIEHSDFVGFGVQKYMSLGGAFVVRRHELDYLAPAFLDDELVVETWVSSMDKMKSTREYRIVRKKDERKLLEGKTLWVYIDIAAGRPKEIPQDMKDAFKPYLAV